MRCDKARRTHFYSHCSAADQPNQVNMLFAPRIRDPCTGREGRPGRALPALRRDPANKAKGRCSRPRFTSFCLQRASHTTAKSKQISPPNLSCTLPCIVAKRPRATRTRSMLHPRASHLAKGRKATHATRGSCGCPSSELVSTPGSLVVRLRHVCQCQGACVSACL